MSDIDNIIKAEIDSAEIVLFMKGTPVFPQCGFSGQVVQILSHIGAPFKGVNVLEDDGLRDGIKTFSNWPTIPQLYVKGAFVGDVVEIREKSRTLNIVLEAIQNAERDVPEYIDVDHNKLTARLTSVPQLADVPYPVQMEPNLVVEFYSRN